MLEADSRKSLARWIRRGTYSEYYQRSILFILIRIDRFLLSEKNHQNLPATSCARAWNFKLLDVSLMMCCMYPIFLLILQWAISGDQIEFSNANYTIPYKNEFIRYTSLISIIIFIIMMLIVKHIEHNRIFLFIFLIIILLQGAISYNISYNFLNDKILNDRAGFPLVDIVSSLAFVGSVALLMFYAAQTLLRQLFVFNRDVFPYGLLVFAALFMMSIFRMGDNDEATYILIYRLAFIIISLFIITIFITNGIRYALFVFLLFSLHFFIGYDSSEVNALAAPFLFFMMPAVNCIFDFLSIGLTRYTMRRGVRRIGLRTLIYSFLDLIAAAAMLITLFFSIYILLSFIEEFVPFGGIYLFDQVMLVGALFLA